MLLACTGKDSGLRTTSADTIIINVIPLITKLHFIVIYFATDLPYSLMATISVITVVTHPRQTLS